MDSLDPSTLNDIETNDDDWKQAMKEQYNLLHRKWLNRVQECRELERTGNNLGGGGGDGRRGDQRSKLLDLVSQNDTLQTQVRDQSEEIEKMKRQIKRKDQQQRYSDALRKDFSSQLQQMEQAVFMTNQIHNRDRKQFDREILEKNQELQRLKHFLKLLSQRNKKMNRTNRVIRPVNRRGGGRRGDRDGDRDGDDGGRRRFGGRHGVRRATKRPSIAINRDSSPRRDSRSPPPRESNRPRQRGGGSKLANLRGNYSPPNRRGQEISDDDDDNAPRSYNSSSRSKPRYSTAR